MEKSRRHYVTNIYIWILSPPAHPFFLVLQQYVPLQDPPDVDATELRLRGWPCATYHMSYSL